MRALTLALSFLLGDAAQAAGVFDDPTWDDGKAEVALYDAREVRYGRARETRAIVIVVKEDLNAETLVKTDVPLPAEKTVTVLKHVQVVTVPTGIYTYRQLLTAFLRRSDLAAVKLTVGSQEWCGNAYRSWRREGDKLLYRGESYFDGEALVTGEESGDAIFADTLPVWLRGQDLTKARELRVRLLPGQISNRARLSLTEEARVMIKGHGTEGLEVAVEAPSGRSRLVFDASPPHVLRSWSRPDGSSYSLLRVERLSYWKLNTPEYRGYFDK